MRIDDQHKQITVVKKEKYDILEEKGRKIGIQRRYLKHYAVKYNFHDVIENYSVSYWKLLRL